MFGLMIWRRCRCGRWWSAIRGSDFGETNDIMMGCGYPYGEQGYNVGRSAQLLAGIDHHVPAVTVSRFCASSLQTIRMAFHAIKSGEGDQYIAAGVERVSRGAAQTFPLMNHQHRWLQWRAVQRVYLDGDHGRERRRHAARSAVRRRTSGRRCLSSGRWRRVTAAISIVRSSAWRSRDHDAGGDVVAAHTVLRDDGPRPGTTVEKLAALKPVFKPDGYGDGRKRLSAQRRRGGGAGDV